MLRRRNGSARNKSPVPLLVLRLRPFTTNALYMKFEELDCSEDHESVLYLLGTAISAETIHLRYVCFKFDIYTTLLPERVNLQSIERLNVAS